MHFNFETGATYNCHCILKGRVSGSKIVIHMVRQTDTKKKPPFKNYVRVFPKIFLIACAPLVKKRKI